MRGFRYLKSDTVTLEDRDEAEKLRDTMDAMNTVGLSGPEEVRAPKL